MCQVQQSTNIHSTHHFSVFAIAEKNYLFAIAEKNGLFGMRHIKRDAKAAGCPLV